MGLGKSSSVIIYFILRKGNPRSLLKMTQEERKLACHSGIQGHVDRCRWGFLVAVAFTTCFGIYLALENQIDSRGAAAAFLHPWMARAARPQPALLPLRKGLAKYSRNRWWCYPGSRRRRPPSGIAMPAGSGACVAFEMADLHAQQACRPARARPWPFILARDIVECRHRAGMAPATGCAGRY